MTDQLLLFIATHKTERVNRTQDMRFYPFAFTGQRERRGDRLRLFWCEVHGPRADDHVAECGSDGR